ncbi:MAG TPA: hypothetical protein VFD27_04410, partial [Chthoniobacteraceae bacterium]|nr:hypothetical protein [Chthoniobacteraceae bacterium]
MQRLRRFARFWDLLGNSGNFFETTPLLWADGASPFAEFLRLSDWLGARLGRRHSIALTTLAECLGAYLMTERGVERARLEAALLADWRRIGRREKPPFLMAAKDAKPRRESPKRPERQARHLAGNV